MSRWARLFINSGYGLALAILVANAVLSYLDIREIVRGNWWVEHTREVVAQLERAASTLKDAETGQRGYLLTGRDEYLRPYIDATNGLDRDLDRLATLTSDNPGQQARVVELRRIAGEKIDELGRTVALRRKGDQEAALAIVQTDRGRQLMVRARALVAEIRDEEDRLLVQRSAASRNAVWRTVASVAIATAMAGSTLLLVSYLKRREDAEKGRATESLRQSEDWLVKTLESIGDGVIATDGRGRVRLMNPIARSLTGWTQEQAVGRPVEEVFHIVNEATRQPAENPVTRASAEGIVLGLANHTTLISRDGTETPIDDSAAPIKDRDGRVVGVVMVFRGIAERRRHEVEVERLLASEREARSEAEHANRAKDHFLAILSHELRTPLNPILLAATAMLERPPAPDELRPALEMIRQNVNLQARLIDDLLDVMRVVRGKMPLQWEVADAHALIGRAVEVCRSEVEGKGIRLETDLAAGHHHVNADMERLQQVLWNLLRNAVKFTPAGGTVTIRTRNEGDSNPQGDNLVIEVADTGIGIEPDALSRIFDPFQQGETTITRKYGGLGLGLAIGRGIVEAHGGTLDAESDGTGRGATFRVALGSLPEPDVARDGRGHSHAPAPPPDPGRLNILLVEDDPTTLRLLARLLRGMGHEVEPADTLARASEVAEADGFDLIISDVGLPDGTGLELMRAITARRGRVPSIALTGYGMEEDIVRSREAGFSAHLTKPIDFMKLEEMIRQVAP